MILTIDTSALLAVLMNENNKSKIIGLTKNCDLLAPAIIDGEIGNALSAMFKRKRLDLSKAKDIIKQYEMVPIRRTELRIQESLEIASRFNLYAYDCYFLDCSLQYRNPLLTLDSRMVEIAKQLNIETLEVEK